jgi:hypothetical protein
VNLTESDQNLNYKGKITVLFTAIILFSLKLIYPEHHVLSWDVFGYYLYLPAKFIYHDPYLLHQEWLNQIVNEYQSTATLYQINQHPDTGHWIIKYSMGMSFLYAPFFFIAHWLAPIFGYKQDGFSAIYGFVIEFGMFLFSIVGLHYLLKVLHSFFETKIAIITFLLIVFATNYVQLNVQYSLLTHVPLFTLYSFLVYYSLQWNKNRQWHFFFIIAATCGFITLIRPNEIICVLIPLLFNIHKKDNLKEKFSWAIHSPIKFTSSAILFVLPILVQMYYWKKGTNQWLYYSYQNPGEGFDFLSPYTYQFLFSFRKGWFIYTPIALIALVSLVVLYKKNVSVFFAILIPTVLSIYIISSWSCWWYAGGSYSQRAILSIYPLLAMSMGFGVQLLFTKFKYLTFLPLALLTLLNLFQAWQFSHDILDHERMTYSYYKKIFFKTHKPKDAESYLLVNRSADENETLLDFNLYQTKSVTNFNFQQKIAGKEINYCDTLGKNDHFSLMMSETNEFVDGIDMKYSQITEADHFWIKAAVDIFIPPNFESESPRIVIHFNHGENGTYKYRDKFLNKENLKPNQWNHLEYLYLSPEVRSKEDNFKVYLWHPSKTKICIDNFNIEVLIPKKL